MDTSNPLSKQTATAETGTAFRAERSGGMELMTPLTTAAEAWLRTNVADQSSWSGDQLAVEIRNFPDLADAIIAAGFTFERDAFPN